MSSCHYVASVNQALAFSVNYMLGERYISCEITHKCNVLFLVVEHNILDACVLALLVWKTPFWSLDLCVFSSDTTLVLTGDSSCISGNISSPFFSANNATVTVYLLESTLAQFKEFCLLFYNYSVFTRVQIKNGNILLLHSSRFISSSMKGAKSSYSAETFPC